MVGSELRTQEVRQQVEVAEVLMMGAVGARKVVDSVRVRCWAKSWMHERIRIPCEGSEHIPQVASVRFQQQSNLQYENPREVSQV